jgi:hypothetical protein
MKKIIWNDDEKEKLIDLVSTMRLNYPDRGILELLRDAQKQFPEGRRRKITNLKIIKWLINGVKAKHKIPVAPPEPQVVSLFDYTVEDVINNITQRDPDYIQQICNKNVGKISTKVLMTELYLRLFDKLSIFDDMERKFDTLASTLHSASAKQKQNVETPVENKSKPKVLIVGLKENQVAIIKERYEHLIELSFYESGKSHLSKMNFSGKCFCMTKFLDHSTYHVLRKNTDLTEINGGMTDLCTSINYFLAQRGIP